MSGGGAKRPRQRGFIRRGVRQPRTLELPAAPEPPQRPHPGRPSQAFIGGLVLIILSGTALLASPWTTESGEPTPLIDAFFTAVSAVAVTGLVTVDTAAHWNFFGEAVILILIQIGGLGFMVGASIVLQVLRRGSTRLSDALLVRESAPSLSLRDAALLSRRIAIFTVVTEAVGALVLTLRFWQDLPPADALWFGVFHSVSAFCNAGFDLQGEFVSLVPYHDSLMITGVVMLLIQLGGLSYLALSDVVTCRRWTRLSVDTKLILVVNGALLLLGTVAFVALEWDRTLRDVADGARPLVALFQSVTARTAGFATVNFADVKPETLFIWMALMFIGGASGSTAGGVKLATVGVIGVALLSTVQGREETQLFGRRVPTRIVFQAMTVVAIMLSLHFVATALLAANQEWFQEESISFVALMFEAMSALATVGLSTGITPSLESTSKLILCALMFLGRVGPLTVFYALQQRRRAAHLRFAAATVRIG